VCFSLNALEKWRLVQFCKQHEIDPQEIDNEVSYYENKQHLEQFVHKSPEDLAKEYGRILEVMEKEISLEQRYGVKQPYGETQEPALILFKTVVLFEARSVNLVKAYLKPYEKNLQFFKRSYIVITAQISETAAIIQRLEDKGVKVEFVGRSTVHQRVWSFVPGIGWRKINV